MQENKINIATEASDRTFHLARTSIYTFIKTNSWFNGVIYLISHSSFPISNRNVAQLKSIYPNIQVFDINGFPLTNKIIATFPSILKSESAAYSLLKAGIPYLPDRTIYFSSKSVFLNSVSDLLEDALVISKENDLNFAYINKINRDAIVASDIESLSNLFDSQPHKIVSGQLFRDSYNYPERKYRLFNNDVASLKAIIFNTFENSSNYQKINQFWAHHNAQASSFILRPINQTQTVKTMRNKGNLSVKSRISTSPRRSRNSVRPVDPSTIHGDGPKMKISFNMATMPERVNTAIQAINSVYDQADVIRLYLNNFNEVPVEFNRPKIEIYQGEDLRSSGKLFWAHHKNEYYFCIDDDLYYPATYARDMISKLNEYNDNAIVSLHGKILKPGKKTSYFRDLLTSLHCLREVKKDTLVHVIGNGVSVFNTNKFYPDYKKFNYHYMDDILVSLQAQEQNISAVVMAHSPNYLRYLPPANKTLHEQYSKNDSTQTQVINSIDWKLIHKSSDYVFVIPSYNRYEQVRSLISQINSFKGSRKIKIVIVDDCSNNDNYKSVVSRLDNVVYHRNPSNNGKKKFYQSINTGFDYLKTLNPEHVIFMADDMEVCHNFFDVLDKCVSAYPGKLINFATYRPGKYSNWGHLNWIDGAFYAPYSVLKRIGLQILPISEDRFKKNPDISSGVWKQYTARLNQHNIGIVHTKHSLVNHSGHTTSVMHKSSFRQSGDDRLITFNFIDSVPGANPVEPLK